MSIVMRPLKIAFVSPHDARDPHTWSGLPNTMVTVLNRAGADVEVISPLNRKARYFFAPKWLACKFTHKFYKTDMEPLLIASYAREIGRRMSGRQFDAILSTEPFVISKLNRPEPITCWSDSVWDLMTDYYFFNPPHSFAVKCTEHEQKALEKAAHAVFASDWAAKGASEHYRFDNNKLAVIPFGPNLEISHDRSAVESALAARRRDLCVLLFLGVDWKRKGGAIALETARLLNDRGLNTELIVAGCKVPGEKPSFVKEIGYISKRTPQGRRQLSHLLRISNFLILPTRAECAGVVFSEASAFGLPIITTDTGGIPTYVRQGVNGVRIPLAASAETYADHIWRLFHDSSAYSSMALAGWEEYRQRLNWETSISSLLSLLGQASTLSPTVQNLRPLSPNFAQESSQE
jgi:glycosyltransferase involved in cell wall biosynthesis